MKKFKPYLVLKVFSYFWLSIVATIVLLLLISSLSFVDVVDKPLKGYKVKELKKISLFLSRTTVGKPSQRQLKRLVHASSKRRYLYLQGPTANLSVASRPLPEHIDLSVLNNIDTQYPHALMTEHFHAYGPIVVPLRTGDYLLYEVKLIRDPPLFIKLKLLPVWVKMAVPVVMSLLFAWLFSRSIVSPIKALRDSANDIGKGRLNSRVNKHQSRNDELGELILDFNKMAEQLESLMGSQKRLLADISHELRSPLTRLSLATGLAKEADESKRRGYLDRIEKEATTLDEMIGSVLMLSRLENRQQHLEKDDISISDLMTPTLQDAEFEAKSVGKEMHVEALPLVIVHVDQKIVVSAIDNVLRNAIRHAKLKINVRVHQQDNSIKIVISDDGPGVPEHLLKKLAEPFYRHSESRTRSSGGAGLGLAIAKKAMAAHSGQLTLRNGEAGGLEVSLCLLVNDKKRSD